MNNNQPNSRWYSGSGIYRHVWLTTLNPVHVASAARSSRRRRCRAASATVPVATEVQNQGAAAASVTVTSTVLDPTGAAVTTGDSAGHHVAAGATSTSARR